MKEIPFLDLKKLHSRYADRMASVAANTIRDASFVGGAAVSEFESAFAEYCDTDHCVGVANGTDSIQLGLEALGIGPGDEVITAANTFFATVEAIEHAGAKTVLVDCSPGTWQINPAAIEAAITPKTAAIIPVHLYGHPAPMVEICKIAERHGLAVIEDAAQAHGARLNGQRVGTFSDIASFSFYPGKNLGACGDGGAIVTDRKDLADTVRTLSQHGAPEKYVHTLMGYNSRLDAMQASFLKIKLEDLDTDNWHRRTAAARYTYNLSSSPELVTLPQEQERAEPVYHLYVIHVANREKLLSEMAIAGVHGAIHYPVACHLQEACKHLKYTEGEFPNAEYNANNCLSLPMFPDITDLQVDRVCQVLRDCLEASSVPSLPPAA